jgi:hypothetical protein
MLFFVGAAICRPPNHAEINGRQIAALTNYSLLSIHQHMIIAISLFKPEVK